MRACGWIRPTRLLPGPLLVKGHQYAVGIDPGSFQLGPQSTQAPQASLAAVTFTDPVCPHPPLLGNWSSEAVVSLATGPLKLWSTQLPFLVRSKVNWPLGACPVVSGRLCLAAGAWGGLGASDLTLGTALGKQPSGPGSACPLLF